MEGRSVGPHDRVAFDEPDVGDGALGHVALRPDEQRLVEPRLGGEATVVRLPETAEVLDVRERPLIGDALEAPRRARHGRRLADRDHDGGIGLRIRAVDVHAHRGVADVVTQRVPDESPDTVAVEPASEQRPRALLQSSQMPVDDPRLPIPHLHRGEMTVAGAHGGSQQIDGGRTTVDLDPRQGGTTHRLTLSAHGPPDPRAARDLGRSAPFIWLFARRTAGILDQGGRGRSDGRMPGFSGSGSESARWSQRNRVYSPCDGRAPPRSFFPRLPFDRDRRGSRRERGRMWGWFKRLGYEHALTVHRRFMRIGGISLPGLGQLRSRSRTDRRRALRSGVEDLDDLLPDVPSGIHDGWIPGLDGAGR